MLLWLKWFAAFLKEARAFAPFSDQANGDRASMAQPHRAAARQHRHAPRRATRARHQRDQSIRVAPQNRNAYAARHHRLSHAPRLRSKDLNQRIAALSQDVDTLVARLLKRLPRGLTRRRPHHTRPERRSVACVTVHAQAASCLRIPTRSAELRRKACVGAGINSGKRKMVVAGGLEPPTLGL